jgi:hypothetical protein
MIFFSSREDLQRNCYSNVTVNLRYDEFSKGCGSEIGFWIDVWRSSVLFDASYKAGE